MRNVAVAAVLPILLACGLAHAQGDEMDFAPEDPGEGMDFAPVDVEKPPPEQPAAGGELTFESDQTQAPRIVVLVIASPGAEPELAQRLTDSFERYVRAAGNYEVIDSADFRAQLFGPGQAAAMDCATNAVCVSGYGQELWIDSIMLGVLYRGEGGWKLEANKVGVERAEVEAYASHDAHNLGKYDEAELDQLAQKLGARLLGLEYRAEDDDRPRTKLVPMRGPVQTTMAWGTAIAAGVFLGTAGIFGMMASSTESEVKSEKTLQIDAPAMINDGKGQATNANIFLGVALAAAAGSAALFLIKPLQEVEIAPATPTPGFDDGGDEGEEGGGTTSILPVALPDGAGVSLTWSLP